MESLLNFFLLSKSSSVKCIPSASHMWRQYTFWFPQRAYSTFRTSGTTGNIIPQIQILGLAGGLSSKRESTISLWEIPNSGSQHRIVRSHVGVEGSWHHRHQTVLGIKDNPLKTLELQVHGRLLLKLGRSRWKPRNFSNTVIKFKKLLSGDFLGSARLCVSTAGGTSSVPGQNGQKKKKKIF